MPSYKEKYQLVAHRLTDMDRRVLVAESTIASLRDKIVELSNQRDTQEVETEADIFIRNQFVVALSEIEQLMLGESTSVLDLAGKSQSEFLRISTEKLLSIGKMLRESHSRAEILLEDLELKPKGKLMKRERREQMRKESISSLAASMSASPQRLASPPPIPVRRETSPFSDRSTRSRRDWTNRNKLTSDI